MLKNLVASLLHASGLLTLLVRRKFRNRAIVLTYHRVLPQSMRHKTFSHDAIIVAPELFERHIKTLHRHFSCLDLNEFSMKLQQRTFDGPAQCLITFDDGWQDNHRYAFDILKRHNTPAVIFVPTDYVGSGALFWQERLGHVLHRLCERDPDGAADHLRKYGWSHMATLAEHRRIEEIKSAVRLIKEKEYSEIDGIITELEAKLDAPLTDYGPDSYLTAEEMREMMQHGIDFQSHGCSHRVLTRLPKAGLDKELRTSARWLEEQLGRRPCCLAYPNGDHNAEVQQYTAESGYHFAFTTLSGYVDAGSDPFRLRRINLSDKVAGSEARLLMMLLLAT